MLKRTILLTLLLLLLSLSLSGCAALEEGIEAGVRTLIRQHDEVWLESWFPTLRVDDLPVELSQFLAVVVAIAAIGAMWKIPSGDHHGILRFLTIILGVGVFVALPGLMENLMRYFTGEFRISEIFDGMNWVEQIIELDILGLVGASWEAAAASIALQLPHFHQQVAGLSLLVFLGCLLATAIVGNTRPLAFSATQIIGVITFPMFWKIFVFWVISVPKIRILGFFSNTDAVNGGFLLGSIGLAIFFYLGLPLIVALWLPAFDFKGEKLPRADVRGVFEGTVARAGAVAGLAGRMPNRRAHAASGSSENGDDGDVIDGEFREAEPPQLPPPAEGSDPSPSVGPRDNNDPDSGGGSAGRRHGGGILPEADENGKRHSREGETVPREGLTQAEGVVLMAGQQVGQQSDQGGSTEQKSRASEGALPELTGEDNLTRAARDNLDAQRTATNEQQKGSSGIERAAKDAFETKTQELERGLGVAATGATLLGHPEVGAALTGASSMISQGRGSFLPEAKSAPTYHRRPEVTPRIEQTRNNSFLPEVS